MPGRWDSHTQAAPSGNYVPGSNEAKAWNDGWLYRYSGAAISVPITDNPFDAAQSPAERAAWDNGWNEANGNSGGDRRGPATTGTPPA